MQRRLAEIRLLRAYAPRPHALIRRRFYETLGNIFDAHSDSSFTYLARWQGLTVNIILPGVALMASHLLRFAKASGSAMAPGRLLIVLLIGSSRTPPSRKKDISRALPR